MAAHGSLGVRTDLEAVGYGVGGADLCAAGVSAPHIRQRIYWWVTPSARDWKDTPGMSLVGKTRTAQCA